MENYAGKICPLCKTEITEMDLVKVCPDCGIPHHQNCWNTNNGCTTFGCPAQNSVQSAPVAAPEAPVAPVAPVAAPEAPVAPVAPVAAPVAPVAAPVAPVAPAAVCTNCGTPLAEGQAFCPRCGAAKAVPQRNVCNHCGAELAAGQTFCSRCGQKVGMDAPVNPAISQFNAGIQQAAEKKNKKPLIIGIAVAAAAVVLVIALLGGGNGGSGTGSGSGSGGGKKGPDFNKLYNEYCISTWATVGSDGSYLSVDTNPYDWDDDGLAYPAAYTAIKQINNALGLPESLTSEMGETTGADGKQSETFEEQGVTVSWKYHPDRGLEVTYKKAN